MDLEQHLQLTTNINNICTMWPSFSFTSLVLLIISTKNISFIHKNFYGLHSFYLFIFCFGEMVNLNLMFAKNMILNLFNDSDLDTVLKLDLYTCKRN